MFCVEKNAKPTVAMLVLLVAVCPAIAETEVFTVNPAQSKVDFTLGGNLHTVHGGFQLKAGSIQFDPTAGIASGELIVDANSGDSGNGMRDRKMKREILESQKYPEISFVAQKVDGQALLKGSSQVQVSGLMNLHGQSHPMTLIMHVKINGTSASADTAFEIPYVKWGLKNPSTLFLRVSDKVNINVDAVGELTTVSHP
jgi:polyisoprenoid-binding protein YceI